MSSIHHPRLKKDAELARDHRVFALAGDKSFRGIWRKIKRRCAKRMRVEGWVEIAGGMASNIESIPPV